MTAITIKKTTQLIDKIINSADSRFKKFGFKKTTVNEIAADLHISKKTLYSVFPSKEEIIREAAWRETVEIMRKFNENIPVGMLSDSLLIALCRFIFTDRIKQGKNGLFRGIYSEENEIRNAYIQALNRVFAAIYEDGRKRGLLKQVNSAFAAEVIVSHVTTAVGYFHNTDKPVHMFDSSLRMIADAVTYKERIVFDAMG